MLNQKPSLSICTQLQSDWTTLHSTWRKFPREFQRTRAKPAKLNGEGQDFINNWPCSDVTTTLQKLLYCPNVRNSFSKWMNHDITSLIYQFCIEDKNQKSESQG